jgi:hypothetical protein
VVNNQQISNTEQPQICSKKNTKQPQIYSKQNTKLSQISPSQTKVEEDSKHIKKK